MQIGPFGDVVQSGEVSHSCATQVPVMSQT